MARAPPGSETDLDIVLNLREILGASSVRNLGCPQHCPPQTEGYRRDGAAVSLSPVVP